MVFLLINSPAVTDIPFPFIIIIYFFAVLLLHFLTLQLLVYIISSSYWPPLNVFFFFPPWVIERLKQRLEKYLCMGAYLSAALKT